MSSMDKKISNRTSLVQSLWDENMRGGAILSEFSIFLATDAESAFQADADLSTIFTACAAIETHLRFENSSRTKEKVTFAQMTDSQGLPVELKENLAKLRKFRNTWIHVENPNFDIELQIEPEIVHSELAEMSELAIKLMVQVLCADQFV
jgi:hypothetical protein